MKSLFKMGSALLSTVLITSCMGFFASAAGAAENNGISLYTGLLSSSSETVEKTEIISSGLDVIAARSSMAVAGLSGEPLSFNAERFACAMNLAEVDHITVTELPDATCGTLYIDSVGVDIGDRLNATDIARMTYEEREVGAGKSSSFNFRVNGSAYDIKCDVYMLDELNYSPTVSLASFVSLNVETYRGVEIRGVLSAYDPEGDETVFEIVRYPSDGRVVIDDASCGTYTYIPNDGYTGKDSFTYVVKDQYGNYSASATVDIEVNTPATSVVYSDLDGSGMENYAISVTEKGVMNGTLVGNNYYFNPETEVSRADLVVTAMNALGISDVPDVDKTVFADDADIKPEMKGYIALAYSKGYISGKISEGEVYFCPDETVKLSEAAVILSNIIGYADSKVTTVFADSDSIPTWSSRAIYSLHTLGILESPDGYANVSENVTRGDMAKLLARAVYLIENN